MFFAEGEGLVNETGKIAGNIKMADVNLKEFSKNLANSLVDIRGQMDGAFSIQAKAAETVRQTLGQTRVVSNQVQDVIAQAAKTTNLIGIDTEKNLELFGALNTAMQRNTFFTDQQITRFQVLGFTANMTSQQLAEMATSFDTLGYTTDETLSTMEMMTDEARSYGVNVSSFMDQVNKNLKLMVTYNFKDGVAGLSKMVAQAQALRIDMSKTVSFADDLLSPEKAIETAAGFQMLGGAVGALGDPFQLLHMAQTDVAGLQDSLVDMAAGAVSFNKETGEFDIPVTQMYRLKEAASMAGMSYQEFSEMAMNAAQRTEKIKLLDQFNTVPEEQKELIASLGKIGANGNLEITMPDGTVKKIGEGFNDLVAGDYGELQKMLDVNNMSELDVAKTSMGYLDEIKNAQNTLIKLTTLNLVQSGGFENLGENITKSQSLLTNSFLKREDQLKYPDTLVEGLGTVATALKVNENQSELFAETVVKGLNTVVNTVDEGLQKALEEVDFDEIIDGMKRIFEGFDLNSVFSGITDIDLFPERTTITLPVNRSNSGAVEVTPDPVNRSQGGNDPTNRSNVVIEDPTNRSNAATGASAMNVTPQSLNVTGEINLALNNVPMGASLSQEELTALLVNNPAAMAQIKSQLGNLNGTWA